jgi:group I intron endonuclease
MGQENYCVYKHTSPVGKVYIGITRNPQRRFSRRGNCYKGSVVFYNAIQKYGWDNIDHEILETGLTVQKADEREACYIALYKSTQKKYGYNILPCGNVSTNGITEEMRTKMSATRKGRPGAVWTKEMKKRLSEKKKGCKGHKLSEEAKKKVIEALTGRPCSEETRRKISESQKGKKAVVQYNLDGDYIKRHESIASAAKSVNKTECLISACCRGRLKTGAGFVWRYEKQSGGDE